MSTQIAALERRWFVVTPEGHECEVALQVGAPSQEPGGDWCVLVGVVGLEPGVYKIFGIDSWQAAILGMKFAAARAQDFSARGWRFFWERGGDLATTQELGFTD